MLSIFILATEPFSQTFYTGKTHTKKNKELLWLKTKWGGGARVPPAPTAFFPWRPLSGSYLGSYCTTAFSGPRRQKRVIPLAAAGCDSLGEDKNGTQASLGRGLPLTPRALGRPWCPQAHSPAPHLLSHQDSTVTASVFTCKYF